MSKKRKGGEVLVNLADYQPSVVIMPSPGQNVTIPAFPVEAPTVKEGCTHRPEYTRESPAHAWVAVPCGCAR
tara:strand:- start:1306 stop:1521 length:216 start_codon:yes stop_codon:yes gene_type:complete